MKTKNNTEYNRQGMRWDLTSFDADGRARFTHNHVGFLPQGPKCVLCADPSSPDYEVIMIYNAAGEYQKDRPVNYRGALCDAGDELGSFRVADFSEMTDEGIFMLVCGDAETAALRVARHIYDYPLRILCNYFSAQRCGDGGGYNAPCHCNDAVRHDNGERVDLAGGWHQSCDLRKWMFGTPFGLMGLVQLAMTSPRWDKGQLDGEIRWGNRYFFNMVRPDGGLMDHVVMPAHWTTQRIVYANDAPLSAFYLLIAAESMCAKYYQTRDPAYAEQCYSVAERLWNYAHGPHMAKHPYKPPVMPPHHEWMSEWLAGVYPGSAIALGQELFAAVWLHRCGGRRVFLEHARTTASQLVDLQVGGNGNDLSAAGFYEAMGKPVFPRRTEYYEFFIGLGLAELCADDPQYAGVARWREAIRRMAERSRITAGRNAFGIIPTFWYDAPQEGVFMRGAGTERYRYFFKESCYQGGLNNFGINHAILGEALFLIRAGHIFGDARYRTLAGRQADWILGCNPFNRSSVEGIGYNQLSRHLGDGLFPATPQIPGAVNTGMPGNAEQDMPQQFIGIGCEYDIPPTALLIWLLTHLTGRAP